MEGLLSIHASPRLQGLSALGWLRPGHRQVTISQEHFLGILTQGGQSD